MFFDLQFPPCVFVVRSLLVTGEVPLTRVQVIQGRSFFFLRGVVHGTVVFELNPRANLFCLNKVSFKLGALRVTTWRVGIFAGDVLLQRRELDMVSSTSLAFSLVSMWPAAYVMIYWVGFHPCVCNPVTEA